MSLAEARKKLDEVKALIEGASLAETETETDINLEFSVFNAGLDSLLKFEKARVKDFICLRIKSKIPYQTIGFDFHEDCYLLTFKCWFDEGHSLSSEVAILCKSDKELEYLGCTSDKRGTTNCYYRIKEIKSNFEEVDYTSQTLLTLDYKSVAKLEDFGGYQIGDLLKVMRKDMNTILTSKEDHSVSELSSLWGSKQEEEKDSNKTYNDIVNGVVVTATNLEVPPDITVESDFGNLEMIGNTVVTQFTSEVELFKLDVTDKSYLNVQNPFLRLIFRTKAHEVEGVKEYAKVSLEYHAEFMKRFSLNMPRPSNYEDFLKIEKTKEGDLWSYTITLTKLHLDCCIPFQVKSKGMKPFNPVVKTWEEEYETTDVGKVMFSKPIHDPVILQNDDDEV